MLSDQILTRCSLNKNKNFNTVEHCFQHIIENLTSFWLDYASKAIKNNQPVVLFSTIASDLIASEFTRQIYSGVTGPSKDLVTEVTNEVKNCINLQFEYGRYVDVKNYLIDRQTQQEILHAQVVADFKKQK
jgi:hypothetical protein